MKFNNKYLVRGLGLIFLGIFAIFWNFGIMGIFEILSIVIPVVIIFLGFKYTRYAETKSLGVIMMFIGALFLITQLGISVRAIIATTFIGLGLYYLLIKSNFVQGILKKGVFKDSREHIFINEFLADIVVNSISLNVSSVSVRSYFSKIILDFSNAELNLNLPVNLNVLCLFGDVKIITKANWNVMINGKVITRVDGSYRTLNVKCTNFLGKIDID